MSDRPKIFDDEEDDLSRFAPLPAPLAPTPERIKAVATAGGFPSRQALSDAPPSRQTREPYRYRTGRTEQFSARIRPEAFDAFYEIARAKGWKIGETVEAALAALQEKLG